MKLKGNQITWTSRAQNNNKRTVKRNVFLNFTNDVSSRITL